MTKKEQSQRLKDLIFEVQRKQSKWKNLEHLKKYLELHDSRIKHDQKRKKGYIVSFLYNVRNNEGNRQKIVLEMPEELAEKILILGDFP